VISLKVTVSAGYDRIGDVAGVGDAGDRARLEVGEVGDDQAGAVSSHRWRM
jgi:hypothetical protein